MLRRGPLPEKTENEKGSKDFERCLRSYLSSLARCQEAPQGSTSPGINRSKPLVKQQTENILVILSQPIWSSNFKIDLS